MPVDQIEKLSKVLSLLTDACRFLVFAGLSAFAIAALAAPTWARGKLQAFNLDIKEVNILGIKLAARESFDIAESLVETKVRLNAMKDNIAKTGNDGSAASLKLIRAFFART